MESCPPFGKVPFPPPPRPRVPGVGLAFGLWVIGTGVIAASTYLYITDWFVRGDFAAGTFIGLLLSAYSVKYLRDRQSVRGLWVSGEIVPGIVVTRARLPYMGHILFSTLMAAYATSWVLADFDFIWFVIGVALIVVLQRVNRRLNSALVFLIAEEEELVARLPMRELWRKDTGDCLWIAVSGRRSAAIHVAAPGTLEFATPDDSSCEWIGAKLEECAERDADD